MKYSNLIKFMKSKTNKGLKIICLNRKARFNYFFDEFFEAGIILKGSEVKSIRKGKVNISEAYAIDKDGEIVLGRLVPLRRRLAVAQEFYGTDLYSSRHGYCAARRPHPGSK